MEVLLMANQDNSAYVQALLTLYNQKRKPIVKTPKEEMTPSANEVLPMGRSSYVNVYDQLYDTYKNDINFNSNMWQTALSRGEQDVYLNLIANNNGKSMSDEYYNPLYYDYNAMMMELYKNSADTTNNSVEERFTQVYNPETGQYETQSVGNMNEQQWIDYQLNEYHTYKRMELDYEMEKIRKESMNWWTKFGHSSLAFLAELGEGALSAITGMVDFVLAPFAAIGIANMQDMNYLDAYVEYYMRGATALEKQNVRAAMDEWERTHTFFIDTDGTQTWAGKWFGGLSNSIGMMIPSIALAAVTGGAGGAAVGTASKLASAASKVATTAAKWIGMSSFYAAIYSSNLYENATNPLTADSPSWLKITNAFVRSAAEAVIEYTLGKVLGGTLPNMLLGMGGRGVVKEITKGLSKKAAVGFMFKSAAQEGLEEFLQDFSTHMVNEFTAMIYEGYEKDGVTFQTLVDSFAMGALMSIAMTGSSVAFNASKRIIGKGQDYYVENADGTFKRIGGLRRIYMNSLLNDFKAAVDSLKTDRITEQNIEVAGEVYNVFSNLTQLFASWDKTRMENATKLLQRVVEHEPQQRIEGTAEVSGKPSRELIATDTSLKDFAVEIEKQLKDMLGEAGNRYKERVKKALDKVADKLKDGNVTQAKAAVSKDGTVHTTDPKLEAKARKLSHKYEKLRKEYEWIFTTDGNVAIDEDGFLFVSEAWLENYEVSDIYKYMQQDKIVSGLLEDKSLHEMMKSIHEFDKQFSNRPNLTEEQALLDFLFNKSVFEAYLLSNKGSNLFKFKNLVFNVMAFIDVLAEEKGVTAEKCNYLKQIKEKVMETWKEPMMKALVNWNLSAQEVGADYVLTARDREFLTQYENKKRVNRNAVKSAKVSSQYIEEANSLLNLAGNKLTNDEKAEVLAGLDAPANSAERLQAVAILNMLGNRYSRKKRYAYVNVVELIDAFKNNVGNLLALRTTPNSQTETAMILNRINKTLVNMANDLDVIGDRVARDSVLKAANYVQSLLDKNLDASQILDNAGVQSSFRDIVTALDNISVDSAAYESTLNDGLFVLTEEAAKEFGIITIADMQNRDNAIKAFENLYNVSPNDLLDFLTSVRQNYNGIIAPNNNFYLQLGKSFVTDCTTAGYNAFDANEVSLFVRNKLENLLGEDYIVTETFKVNDYSADRFKQKMSKVRKWLAEAASGDFKNWNLLSMRLADFAAMTRVKGLELILKHKDSTYLNANMAIINSVLNEVENKFNNPLQNNIAFTSDYQIARKIPAQDLLKSIFLEGDITVQDQRILTLLLNSPNGVPLSEFIKIVPTDERAQAILSAWHVKAVQGDSLGYIYDASREIGIDITGDDILGTLVHEINHALQFEYYTMRGGDPENFIFALDALQYIAENYTLFANIVSRMQGKSLAALNSELQNGNRDSDGRLIDDTVLLDGDVNSVLSYCAYSLLQGEIWNEMHMQNGKLVNGFTFSHANLTNNIVGGINYLVSPDGKHKFEIPISMTQSPVMRSRYTEDAKVESTIENNIASPSVVANAIEQDFENSLASYAEGNVNARNTVHAGLTRISAREVIAPLLSDELSLVEKGSATIGDIIANPTKYLKAEIAAHMVNMDEGQAYRFLREYLEEQNAGISIDRDENTHAYVLVDDKAFDDMFTRPVASLDGNGTDIYNEFNGKEEKLSAFYRQNELDKFGINDSVTVEFSPNGNTETIIDRTYPYGHIVIKTHEGMTNDEIMMRLNHEFRHLLQYYNGFEAGFTPDFKITDEMRADIKKHVPNIFKIADKYYQKGTISRERWENFVIQRFFYFLTGGEQNAFGLRADMLQGKPVFVTEEAGHPTIFAPWYDAKTGDGRYKTDFIANRSIDENENGPKLKKNTSEYVMINGKRVKVKQLKSGSAEGAGVDETNEKLTDEEKRAQRLQPKKLTPHVVTEESEAEARARFEAYQDKREAEFNASLQASRDALASKYKAELEDYDNQVKKARVAAKNFPEPAKKRLEAKMAKGRKSIERKYEIDKAKLEKELDARKAKFKRGTYIGNKLGAAQKYTSGERTNVSQNPDQPQYKYKYVYDNPKRYYSWEEAQGTNLEYFYKKSKQNQMDPDLREFIKATTGKEDILPRELAFAIKKGKLTKQALIEFIQKTPSKQMTQELFDLINKTMFHNTSVRDAAQLNKIVNNIAKMWAMARLFEKRGVPTDDFFLPNDFEDLLSLYDSLMANPEYSALLGRYLSLFFTTVNSKDEKDNYEFVDVRLDKEFKQYLKTLVLGKFDGSLASAYYIAKIARKAAIGEYRERKSNESHSLNETIDGGKGDDSSSERGDNIVDESSYDAFEAVENDTPKSDSGIVFSTKKDNIENNSELNTRIKAYYEMSVSSNLSADEMRTELAIYKGKVIRKKALRELRKKYPATSESKLAEIVEKQTKQDILAFGKKLARMSDDAIIYQYNKLQETLLTNNAVDEKLEGQPTRVSIVNNIKGTATKLLGLVNKGKKTKVDGKEVIVHVVWGLLPQDVRDMFQEEEVTVRGVKQKVRTLKPEVYSVGRGAVKGARVFGKEQDLTHDTTKIVDNMRRLNEVLSNANRNVYSSQDAVRSASAAEKRLQQENKKLQKQLSQKTKQAIKEEGPKKETQFTVKKRKRTNDTPNNFTIVSATEMPSILRKIFDTSFEDMADTKVQFASKDEEGNYYDKETNEKTFNSRLQHEVSNWEAFYETNRETLLNLTRTEVMQIVDFIEGGATTFDGPANKLYAFQIFTLGYIVDAARRNINGWNFSIQEVEAMEALYEKVASAYGSGLNAVAQMKKVIDPYKKVRQHMLEEYGIDDYDLEPLIVKIDMYQQATDQETRDRLLKEVIKEQTALERKMMMNKSLENYELMSEKKKARIDKKYGDVKEWAYLTDMTLEEMTDKEFFQKVPILTGKSVYDKIKSMRYTFMLSSPMTWMRNIWSNVVQTGFIKASEVLSNVVFKVAKKSDYREGQWDLTHVKTTPEVKDWIYKNILSNPLFNSLYDVTSKYDNRKKDVGRQKDLFVTLLTRSIEQKFAVEHRFDSRAANMVSTFINHMISDKRFVRFATGRYLGKIITQEVEAGNIDLSEGVTNKVLDLFADAMLLANQDYMHRRSFAADMIDGLKDKHPVAYEILVWWQPFLNSSLNWFTEMLNYTPVGIIRGIHNMVKLEDRITAADAAREKHNAVVSGRLQEYLARRHIGKGILGTILIGLGLLMGALNWLRIDEDDDKFYLTVGDIKVDISNIFGTSSILVGAALTQLGRDENKDGEADYGLEDILGFIAEYMSEGFLLKDILDRHRWDEGFYDGMLTEMESVMRSFVPQFVQLFVRAANNQDIKYSSGFIGVLERWLNTFVPTQPFGQRKINPYTGEVETKYAIPFIGELLKGGLIGPRIYWEYTPDYEEYARGLGVNKGQLTTTEIEEQEIDNLKLNEKYGQLNGSILPTIEKGRHLVEMPDGTFKTLSWDQMSDEQRARVINRTMQNNAEAAKAWYWTQVLGKKYYASPTIYKLLKQLGITKNVYRGDKGFVK